MSIYKGNRFDLVWLGEIKEDGTEETGYTVASAQTLEEIRLIAGEKGITDWDHRIDEIGPERVGGFTLEGVVKEHKISI